MILNKNEYLLNIINTDVNKTVCIIDLLFKHKPIIPLIFMSYKYFIMKILFLNVVYTQKDNVRFEDL